MITGYLATPSPRLPDRPWAAGTTAFSVAAWMHVGVVALLITVLPAIAHRAGDQAPAPPAAAPDVMRVVLPRIVFVPSQSGGRGGGGGGGGNRQTGPIRHAEGKGHDAVTLRTTRPLATSDQTIIPEPDVPALVLDARSLASGNADQIGLPVGGVSFGTSTGPGSGGGVGTGTGTGIGPGRGPGFGPGEGGGVGGGVYRTGSGVTEPRLISEVKPRYTSDALRRKVTGSVWLDLVVTREGHIDQVRVARSLDPGLDEAAIAAVHLWRFQPGRLGNTPVDVAVRVEMDFSIR
jgi:TonB family protein